ncbi:MAG: glycosyltransferase [Sediminispirochaetaceae bacterium]
MLHVFLWSAAAYWAAGFFLLWRIPKLGRLDAGEGTPADEAGNDRGRIETDLRRLSIIIPARNESGTLPFLLDSLKKQEKLPLEIIVVDDQSIDGTGDLARGYGDIGVRVIVSEERPKGWTGKNWSCHQGSLAAQGDYLLFLDADTSLTAPDSLLRLLQEYRRRGGLLSVQPYHRVHALYEQLSGFFNLIVMIGSGAFSKWSRPGEAVGCFGPCILMNREDYRSIGGHEAVRAEVVDDLALSRLCREAGTGVHCFGGRETISFRMYPGGLGSLVEGWTKNMAVGASLADLRTIILLVVWFTGISNAALMIAALSSGGFWFPWGLIVLAVYGLYVLQVFIQLRRVGSFHFAAALFFPLLFLFFVVIFLYSVVRVKVLHSVTWKGREIEIGRGG